MNNFNESTKLSWLWAFVFGPFWFMYIGAGKYALISLVLTLLGIGIIINPFMAYPAHRAVAERKAALA